MNTKHSRNKNHRRDLERSEKTVGQLYPVLRDARGRVIDGYHRLDVNPEWKSVTLYNVKSEEDRLIVSAHVNLGRREISRDEKVRIVNDLAEIYYQQGLRPDVIKEVIGKNDRKNNVHFNEIKHKINEVLNGVITKSNIKNYLYPKYLNQEFSKRKKEYYRKRRENTSAYDLLLSSHGTQLRKTYGDDFFDRLKKEMMEDAMKKAKQLLRFDREFINKVKYEIREDYEAKIKEDIENELNMMVVA